MTQEYDMMAIRSSYLVLSSTFLLLIGFYIVPYMIDMYIQNITLPPLIDAENALNGLKLAGMVVAASFGAIGFLYGSAWLVISLVFSGVDRLMDAAA